MTFTPTATSSASAGFVFWGVVWSIIFKIDTILKLFHIKPRKERILNWMTDNKVLTLSCTEVINFSIHGISNPASTIFALGGTLMNIVFIFLCLPIRKWSMKGKSLVMQKKAA